MENNRTDIEDWTLITTEGSDYLRHSEWDFEVKFRTLELNMSKDEIKFITPNGFVVSIGINELPTQLIDELGKL